MRQTRTVHRLRPALVPLVVMLFALAATVAVGRVLLPLPAVARADLQLLQAVNGADTPVGISVARVLDVAFGPVIGPCVAFAVVAAIGIARRSMLAGLRAAIVLGSGWKLTEAVKLLVQRARPVPGSLPHHPISEPSSSSFPSGHTALAAAVAVACVLAAAPGRWRRAAVAAGIVLVVLTGWSRLALGVHFPADVLASALLVPVVAVCMARIHDALAGHPGSRDGRPSGAAQPPSDPPRPAGAGPEPTSPNRARPNMVSFAPTPGRIANSPDAVCWRYSLIASERVILSRIG